MKEYKVELCHLNIPFTTYEDSRAHIEHKINKFAKKGWNFKQLDSNTLKGLALIILERQKSSKNGENQ